MITDHVFRMCTARADGLILGACAWLGRCNRPQDEHITVHDFRRRRAAV